MDLRHFCCKIGSADKGSADKGAAVGTDVEVVAVLFYGLHNLARAGAAVHPGTPDVDVVRLEI